MEQRNFDTSYMDITDIVSKNYKPTVPISPEIGLKIMDDLNIIDESDTYLRGSFDDWCRLISFILDKYQKHHDEDPNNCEFDLTQLQTTEFDENGILSEYLDRFVKIDSKENEIPKMVTIKGELPQLDKFYLMIKEYENQKSQNKGIGLSYDDDCYIW